MQTRENMSPTPLTTIRGVLALLLVLILGGSVRAAEELPADLKNELKDIQSQIDSVSGKLDKLDQAKFDLNLQEIKQRVDEFALDAELLDNDPILTGLQQSVDGLTKKWAEASSRPKEAMPDEKKAPAIKPEELDALIELPVDLSNVSFKRDVAPIIFNACCRCHQGGSPAGDFDCTTYESFLTMIEPGDPENSHVLNLVTGKEEPRMPRGNLNRFSKQWIDIWTAWIKQGAKFDGPDKKATINTYLIDLDTQRREAIGRMPADKAEAMHRGYAQRHMEILNPRTPLSSYESEHFLVYTTLGAADTEYVAILAEATLERLKEEFRWKQEQPIWRGRLGLYVFAERHDYVAFAKEIDQYDVEATEFGHSTMLPAYQYLAMTTEQVGSAIDPAVIQQVSAAFAKSLGPKIPDWAVYGFAEVDAKGARQKDSLREAATLVAGGKKLEDLLGEKVPWKQLEPLAISFFSYLDQQHKKQIPAFLTELSKDGNCWEAAKKSLGATPDPLSKDWAAWLLAKAK